MVISLVWLKWTEEEKGWGGVVRRVREEVKREQERERGVVVVSYRYTGRFVQCEIATLNLIPSISSSGSC